MARKILFMIITIVVSAIPAFSLVKTVPAGCKISWESKSVLGLNKRIVLTVTKDGYKPFRQDFAASSDTNNVIFVRMSPTNSKFSFVKRFKTRKHPKDLIFSPDGKYLMICNMEDDGIQVYDYQADKLRKITVPVYGKRMGFVEGVFNKDGSEFWFTQMYQQGRIFILDMKTLTVKTNFPSEADWTKVGEFSPDFSTYYASNWLSADFSVFDAKTFKLLTKFKAYGKEPRGIGFTEDSKYVYGMMFGSGEIIKYSVESNYRVVNRVTRGGTCGRFRIDRKKDVAYVNDMRYHKIYVYDMNQDKIAGEFDTAVNPNNVRLSADGKTLYVSSRGPNNPKGYDFPSLVNGKMQVFDVSTTNYTLVEELPLGNQPIGIALLESEKIVAFSNYMEDTIEIYRIEM